MRKTNTYKDNFKCTLAFGCHKNEKCLALAKLKHEVPWIELATLSDGTVIATGYKIKTLQYGSHLSKQIKRICSLCKKRKLNGR